MLQILTSSPYTGIPVFPYFKNISIQNKETIESFTVNFLPYSDYNFVSLWAYNTRDDAKISLLNNNLTILFRDYITNELFYSFIGKTMIFETINILLDKAINENITPKLKLIPEETILTDKKLLDFFKIDEDRDNFDYLLSINELSELKGSKYAGYRKDINRFYRKFPHAHVKNIDINDDRIKNEIINLFNIWTRGKNKDSDSVSIEFDAIKRVLLYSRSLELFSFGLYDRDNLIGFSIIDLNRDYYAQSHFMKINPAYYGGTYFLRHNFAKTLNAMGYKYLNIEQDLGILGLRAAKEHSNPLGFLKKYVVTRK